MVLEKKIFKVFTIYFYVKHEKPQGGANLTPGGMI